MPTTGLITCTLAGTPIAFDRSDTTIGFSHFVINDRLGEIPNVANGRVRGMVPAVGMELIALLTGSSERIFAGHVIAVHEASIAKPQDLAFDIQAIDYTWLLNRRKVTKRYTSTTAGAILADLVSNFTSGFTATAVETAAGNESIDEITFTFEEFTTALTRLAKRIGAYWYCDYTKDIHFFFSETGSNPTALTVSHTSLEHDSVNVSTDLSQVVTRIKHEGRGTTSVFSRLAGSTTLPIVDDTPFNAAGGSVVVESQELTYTGLGVVNVPNGTWQLVASTAGSYFSVCWSPDLNLFCAVGQSGAVITSPDGLIWTGRTAAEANDWECVCWSPQQALFVAVSLNGTNQVMTSPNGTTWTARAESEANLWVGVCWAAELSLFVAVAASGTHRVMTSPDGITWTNRTAASADAWVRVAWSPSLSLLVAVANTSGTASVMTSPDGTTWTSRSHSTFKPWDVVWAESLGLFVVAGDDQFMTSSNGTSWTLSSFSNTARTWNGITYAPEVGQLIATARETSITDAVAMSPDGVSWNVQSVPSSGGSWQSVTWSPELGIFVAVSGSVGPTFPVLVSVGDPSPQLEGIPDSGAGSITKDVPAGSDVNLLVTVNDTAAQTALATLIGGDGITEDYLQDRRLSEDEATARATAHLDLRKNPEVTLRYRCRDILTRSGRTISVPAWLETSTMVGAWALSERTGTSADDLTTGNHNGTYVGSPTLNASGPTSDLAGGVTLNGSSQYVTMGDVSAFEFTSAFSVSVWFKTTSTPVQQIMVSKSSSGGVGWFVAMPSGVVRFAARTAAAAIVFLFDTPSTYADGQWHQAVCTWDGTTNANKVQIYIDGTVVKQGTANAGTIGSGTEPFLIGAFGSPFASPFTGSLAKVAVYNAELTSTQVAAIYAARRWPTPYLGDLTIQDVTISDFSQKNSNLFPTYDVVASSTRFSFEDLLRRVPRDTTA